MLVSPNGKAISGVPVTDEADCVLAGWFGVLAGELYATVETGRPHVFDLHSALGGGGQAAVGRLRFAAFDILRDGRRDCLATPFTERVKRIQALLQGTQRAHAVDFTAADGPAEVEALFQSRIRAGEEGVVVCCADGRVFKIKPKIAIDAAVVAFTETASGIGELLLGLLADGRTMQIIGRVDTGFSNHERYALAEQLRGYCCECALHVASRSGLPYRWVRPEVVVEVVCHEVLSVNSDGEPIRRWRLAHVDAQWNPLGKAPSISLRDAVFVRVRDDKRVALPDVRWAQVRAFTAPENETPTPEILPASTVLRREVYAKKVRDDGLAVRKLVLWKTNKESLDPRYPAYAAVFTDYSPARQEPMATELRAAQDLGHIVGIADRWLSQNICRGWNCVSKSGGSLVSMPADQTPAPALRPGKHTLTIGFARSTSPTFPIVRKRLDSLASLGELKVTTDDSGKQVWFELQVRAGLVESYRRVANLM